jgi:hypothetical protein
LAKPQRGWRAFVGHIADDEAEAAIGQRDEIAEITAHRLRGLIVGGDVPITRVGHFFGEQGLLDVVQVVAEDGIANGNERKQANISGQRVSV